MKIIRALAIIVVALTAYPISAQTSIRVATTFSPYTGGSSACLDRARNILVADYPIEEVTAASVYAGTTRLTAVIRCDMPGMVVFVIAATGMPHRDVDGALARLQTRFRG